MLEIEDRTNFIRNNKPDKHEGNSNILLEFEEYHRKYPNIQKHVIRLNKIRKILLRQLKPANENPTILPIHKKPHLHLTILDPKLIPINPPKRIQTKIIQNRSKIISRIEYKSIETI